MNILDCMSYGVVKKYKKNEIIFREGDKADCMFELRWGTVGLYVDYGTENERLLAKLEGEGIAGAFSIIDKSDYKVTAVSLQRGTRLESISAEDFYDFFQSKPSKLLSITQCLCQLHRNVLYSYAKACKKITELESIAESKEAEA